MACCLSLCNPTANIMKIGTTLTHWIIHTRPQGEPETGDFVGLINDISVACKKIAALVDKGALINVLGSADSDNVQGRSEEHTSELQSRGHLVCRLLLEKKKKHRQQLPR